MMSQILRTDENDLEEVNLAHHEEDDFTLAVFDPADDIGRRAVIFRVFSKKFPWIVF